MNYWYAPPLFTGRDASSLFRGGRRVFHYENPSQICRWNLLSLLLAMMNIRTFSRLRSKDTGSSFIKRRFWNNGFGQRGRGRTSRGIGHSDRIGIWPGCDAPHTQSRHPSVDLLLQISYSRSHFGNHLNSFVLGGCICSGACRRCGTGRGRITSYRRSGYRCSR